MLATRAILLCIDPEWASMDQGVFVCINCSGVFRSFGRVKSVALDGWTSKEIEVTNLIVAIASAVTQLTCSQLAIQLTTVITYHVYYMCMQVMSESGNNKVNREMEASVPVCWLKPYPGCSE